MMTIDSNDDTGIAQLHLSVVLVYGVSSVDEVNINDVKTTNFVYDGDNSVSSLHCLLYYRLRVQLRMQTFTITLSSNECVFTQVLNISDLELPMTDEAVISWT